MAGAGWGKGERLGQWKGFASPSSHALLLGTTLAGEHRYRGMACDTSTRTRTPSSCFLRALLPSSFARCCHHLPRCAALQEAPQRPKSDHDTHTHTLAKKASTKSAITKSTSGNGSGAKGSIKAEGDSSHSPPVRTKSGVTKHHFDYDAVKVEVFESGWKKAKSQWTGTILCPTEEEARRIMAIDGKPDDRCFGKNVCHYNNALQPALSTPPQSCPILELLQP